VLGPEAARLCAVPKLQVELDSHGALRLDIRPLLDGLVIPATRSRKWRPSCRKALQAAASPRWERMRPWGRLWPITGLLYALAHCTKGEKSKLEHQPARENWQRCAEPPGPNCAARPRQKLAGLCGPGSGDVVAPKPSRQIFAARACDLAVSLNFRSIRPCRFGAATNRLGCWATGRASGTAWRLPAKLARGQSACSRPRSALLRTCCSPAKRPAQLARHPLVVGEPLAGVPSSNDFPSVRMRPSGATAAYRVFSPCRSGFSPSRFVRPLNCPWRWRLCSPVGHRVRPGGCPKTVERPTSPIDDICQYRQGANDFARPC